MKLWTGIVTDRLVESRDFYCQLFNCEVVFEADWFVLLQLGGGELGLLAPDLESQNPLFRRALKGGGVWVAIDVDDVDAEYERIHGLGIAIEQQIRDEPWGDRHFVILDPNGVAVDVVRHADTS